MTQADTLPELEGKVFRSFFGDGLWDVYAGMVLVGFGLSMILEQIIFLLAATIIGTMVLISRSRILNKHLGYVKFSDNREKSIITNKTSACIAGMAILILTVTLLTVLSIGKLPDVLASLLEDHFLVFFGLFLAVTMVIAGVVMGTRRSYLYALVIFLSFLGASIFRSHDIEGWFITGGGGVILVSGFLIFARFLRQNPVPPEALTNGQ